MDKVKFFLNCGAKEKLLFFIFGGGKKSVLKCAKLHNSALNPAPVFVLAAVNGVTHKGPRFCLPASGV